MSSELNVSQASVAGILRRLGRDESSQRLTYELMHSWRSRGDKMRLESAEPKLHPHDAAFLTHGPIQSHKHKKTYYGPGGGGGSGRNPNRASYASTTPHSASLQTPKSASSRPYFAKCCWYAPMLRSFASLSR